MEARYQLRHSPERAPPAGDGDNFMESPARRQIIFQCGTSPTPGGTHPPRRSRPELGTAPGGGGRRRGAQEVHRPASPAWQVIVFQDTTIQPGTRPERRSTAQWALSSPLRPNHAEGSAPSR